MKKVSIYNSYVKDNVQKRELIAGELRKRGFHTMKKGELLIVIGGDGTFLSAVKKKIDYDPVFVVLNAGNLGFFSEFGVDDIDSLIQTIQSHQYNIEEVPLYEVHLHERDGVRVEYFINEVVISYKENDSDVHNAIHMVMEVDGQVLFKAPMDNMMISSMYGSTGHNLSANGPISFAPNLLNVTMTNSIMNRAYPYRTCPAVIPDDKEITVFPSTQKQRPFKVICDSQGIELNKCRYVSIRKSDKSIKLLRTKKYSRTQHIHHNLLNFE